MSTPSIIIVLCGDCQATAAAVVVVKVSLKHKALGNPSVRFVRRKLKFVVERRQRHHPLKPSRASRAIKYKLLFFGCLEDKVQQIVDVALGLPNASAHTRESYCCAIAHESMMIYWPAEE